MGIVKNLRRRSRLGYYGQPQVTRALTRRFHRMYYYLRGRTWRNTFWLGTPVNKCPLDLWVLQEILVEVKPDLIIETGTAMGGSALFYASMLDLLGRGKVITVDVKEREGRPQHERITYLTGSSIADDMVARVREQMQPGDRVLVTLDSDHSRNHVLEELRIYGELVTPGSYCIVEDSNVNGHPISPEFGPGPMEAIHAFLAQSDAFEVDESREKFFLTFNPSGFLKRVK